MKPLALAIFGVLAFLGAIYSSAAQVSTIEITGNVDEFVSSEPSSRPPDTEATFHVTLSTNAWRYRLEFKAYRVGKGAKAIEISGDGTDVYEAITFDPETLAEYRKTMTTPPPGTMSDQTARVYPGRIPGTPTPIELAPWLAFCSKAYFSKAVIDQGLMTNIFNSSYWPTNQLRFDITWSNPGSISPESLAIYKPGFFEPLSRQSSARNRLPTPYPPPYENGYIGAKYVATSWTNTGSIVLPQGFTIHYPDLHFDNEVRQLSTSLSIVGKVTEIRMASRDRILPSIASGTHVRDARFRNGVDYFADVDSRTNRTHPSISKDWLSRDDSDLWRKISSLQRQ